MQQPVVAVTVYILTGADEIRVQIYARIPSSLLGICV